MQRYDTDGMDILYPNPVGPWVKVEDALALEARVAELETDLADSKRCARYEADVAGDAIQTMNRYRDEVMNLLKSASPHPVDNPTMHRAWVRATNVLAESGHPVSPNYLK